MKTLIRSLVCAFATLCAFQLSAASIGTAAEFVAAMNNDPTGSYTLTADIDLTDAGYTTIASFSGTLDGAGHKLSGIGAQPLFTSCSGTLKNLKVDGSGATIWGTQTALVCTESRGATFQDVSVGNVTIKVNDANKGTGIGLFVGMAYDGTSFVRCETLATAIVTGNGKANDNVGGFVGKAINDTVLTGNIVTFTDCTNHAVTVAYSADNSGGQGHGGFVGKCQLKTSATSDRPEVVFTRCVNAADIEIKTKVPTGGFVGRYQFSGSGEAHLVLTNCVNLGAIATTGSISGLYAGGFVGLVDKDAVALLSGCVNRGAVNIASCGYAGGFIGYVWGYSGAYISATFRECANYGQITSTVSAGFVSYVNCNGNRSCGVVIRNCANYGVTDGAFLGKCVAMRNVTTLDNVFSPSQTLWANLDSNCTTPTVNNAVSEADVGYVAKTAAQTLSARAELYGWDKWWTVGKASGKPELLQWSGDVIVVCKVRFLDWDDTVLKLYEVEQGESVAAPPKPNRSGYVFTGWDKSTACVMTDMDVKAQYRTREAGEIDCSADFVTDITANPAGSYTLTADIDLTDSGYATVSEFSGSLNGASHKIVGLGSQQLFTTISGAIVNLTLDGMTLSGVTTVSGLDVGVLCNIADGAAFTNVIVRGYRLRHNTDNKGDYIGLFAASAKCGAEFVRCETGADASAGQPSGKRNCGQGGFVGKIMSSDEIGTVAHFIDCTNRAEIVYEAGNATVIWGSGGFVGTVGVGDSGGTAAVRFKGCVNFGMVNGSQCGGIVGYVVMAKDACPGQVFFTSCENYGEFGSGTMNAGGIVGRQAQTLNTGVRMVFSGCVNHGEISVASENAGGIVGWTQGARNNSTMGKMFFTNCANYAEISVDGRAGGIVGLAKDGGMWGGSLDAIVCNCANYCTISGSSAGDIIGKLGPSSSANSITKGHIDNCFGISANAVGVSEGCAEVSITNIKSSADDGYTPAAAKSALKAVAREKGYEAWKLGELSDGTVVPELESFCTKPYSPRFVILISGVPSAAPTPPSVVANRLLNLAPASTT